MSIYSTPEQASLALLRANHKHKVRLIADWIDMDDSGGHVECSCGWRSREVKVCWLRELADKHLAATHEGKGV
jgi:hypothetical protein